MGHFRDKEFSWRQTWHSYFKQPKGGWYLASVKKKKPKDISNLDTFTKKSVYMGTKSHNCIYNNARDMIEKYRKFER